MKTLRETITALKERWGEHDSDFLLSSEVRTMSPEERKEFLNRVADSYLQADSETSAKSSRDIIQAQRDAYIEGNCKLYDDN